MSKIDFVKLKKTLDKYSGANRKVKGAKVAMAGLTVHITNIFGRTGKKVIIRWLSGTGKGVFDLKPVDSLVWKFDDIEEAQEVFFELEDFIRRYEVDNNIPYAYDGMVIKL